jgi:Zn finger protein HypA/HybF involved in hydrogenase expression
MVEEKKEVPTKIVCESEWHKEIELEHFQECPICHSTAWHRVLKFIGGRWV